MTSNDPNLPARQAPALPATAPKPNPLRALLAPGVLIVIALVLWAIFMPRGNPNERLATRVTVAIINNDMRPVANDFNAIPREQLKNRAKVALLSQDLNDLGKLKGVKEDTKGNAAPRYHHFEAEFEKGTWEEDLTYDTAGKIGSFHVHAPAADLSR